MPRLLALSVTVTSAFAVTAADWPQLLGPARDGHSEETALNWSWPKEGPAIVWTKEIGTGWAGPVVAGGRLYLFHRVSDHEVLACFDPTTGKQHWSSSYETTYRDDFGFDDGPRATPTVADGLVFTLGANGDLSAFNARDGKRTWNRNLRADYKADKGFFGFACSPLVIGKSLLVNVGGRGAGVVAFETATGKETWKSTDDGASYSSPVAAVIGGKPVAVFLTRFGLRVLDADTGAVRHELPFRPRLNESVQAATPLIWKDEIFLTVSYSTGAALLRAKDKELEEVWANDKSLSCQYNSPVRVGEYLYGVHGRADVGTAVLRCIEWKTGAVKWSQPNFGVASLIAVDGGILALTEAGELVRFDASSNGYKERGRAAILTKPTRAHPALAEGRLFARDGAKLVCVKLK